MFNRFATGLMVIATLIILSFTFPARAVDIECPIIADTMLSGHSTEHETNCGARTSLRVKGYQGIVVFRFDMSALERHKVEGGILTAYCKSISGEAQEKSFSEKISTIAHDWVEGTGDYTPSVETATFDWPGKEIAKTWGDDDNDGQGRNGVQVNVMDVINGYGDSILNSQGGWDFKAGEWTDIELDAELVQGLVDGEQYGIVVWRETVGVNLDLSSREDAGGNFTAKLVVHSTGAAVDANGKLACSWGELKSPQ
jgi:hypothetical protein